MVTAPLNETRGGDAPTPPLPREDAALLRATLDALPMHVCVLDERARVLWVNRAWKEFAQANGGDAQSDCAGMDYLAVCDAASGDEAADAHAVAGLIRRVMAGQQAHGEVEYPCHGPDELRWFVAQVSRLPGEGPARVVVCHLPVTARRIAEARQREHQRLEALGALAAGIAHDFNNVLGAVLGNAALARRGLPAGHAASEPLQHIQRAAQRARALVRRVLAFGRREAAEPAPLALVPLLEETLALLRVSQPPGARLSLRLDGAAYWVRADATELQQLLMNLCTNAWLALPPGGGTVTVGVGPGPGADSVHLWVRDDGRGMSPQVMARCFEPFFTTRPAGQGTGLGLSQVRAAVQRCGGRVAADSSPGRGSTFHVYLPLCAAPAEPAQAGPGADDEPGSPPAGAPARARLLLVDDDEVVGLTLQAVLEHEGHRVERHANGTAALAALAAAGPGAIDLVVTDQSMPEMTGTELCRRLRAQGLGLPVLVISGYVSDDLRRQARALGVAALVAKEDAFEALPRAVAGAMARRP